MGYGDTSITQNFVYWYRGSRSLISAEHIALNAKVLFHFFHNSMVSACLSCLRLIFHIFLQYQGLFHIVLNCRMPMLTNPYDLR